MEKTRTNGPAQKYAHNVTVPASRSEDEDCVMTALGMRNDQRTDAYSRTQMASTFSIITRIRGPQTLRSNRPTEPSTKLRNEKKQTLPSLSSTSFSTRPGNCMFAFCTSESVNTLWPGHHTYSRAILLTCSFVCVVFIGLGMSTWHKKRPSFLYCSRAKRRHSSGMIRTLCNAKGTRGNNQPTTHSQCLPQAEDRTEDMNIMTVHFYW